MNQLTISEERDYWKEKYLHLKSMTEKETVVNPKYLIGLSKNEIRILSTLIRKDVATHDSILDAMYWDCEEPARYDKIIHVYICRLRKKLKKHKIKIINIIGTGYMILLKDRERLRNE